MLHVFSAFWEHYFRTKKLCYGLQKQSLISLTNGRVERKREGGSIPPKTVV